MSHHGTPAAAASNASAFYLTTTTTCSTVVVSSATATLAGEELTNFDENSPRPPVLGEEHEPVQCSGAFPPGSGWGTGRGSTARYSPSLTPRRASLACHQDAGHCRQSDAPLGFEPEGSERATPGSFVELGTPPYLRWAISLFSLLDDPDGVAIFKQYLELEGSTDMLDFWFACEGLKREARDDANVAQLVRLIHKRYFKASSPLKVDDALRKEVYSRVREVSKGGAPPDRHLFDKAQKQVEIFINDTAYPEFLRSEVYLRHVRMMQSGPIGRSCQAAVSGGGSEEESSSSSSSTGKEVPPALFPLPTLHEDAELEAAPGHYHHHHHHHHPSSSSQPPRHGQQQQQQDEQGALPLTRDMLIATQKKRALEPRPRLCLQKTTPSSLTSPYYMPPSLHHRGAGGGGNAPGLNYSAYNPVSRQDSELQSLSSDAHTEDSASITNSSLDGGSLYRSSRRHVKQMRENASHNRDPFMHHTIIPRTQRIPKENMTPRRPDEFAAILIQKLECVQRERESMEMFEKKILESDCGVEGAAGGEALHPRLFVEAFRERLQADKPIGSPLAMSERLHFTDDSNQSILDMHVSRVWSDLTPSRSPGLVSPRPRSPEGRRRAILPGFLPLQSVLPTLPPAPSPMTSSQGFPGSMGAAPHPYQSRLGHGVRHGRKEKDGVSTLSSDSGNVHDYSEAAEHKHQHHYIPKSKSMPDYAEAQKQESYTNTGHDSRLVASRKPGGGGSRKTLTDLTDSGVSVVSDTPPCITKESSSSSRHVLSWLLQSETKQVVSGAGYSHSDSSSKHRGRSGGASGSSSINLQWQGRGSKKSGNGGSRSGSIERSPGQPFVADPSMPPLPSPHTATQLEEARRRLEDVRVGGSSTSGKGNSSRQRHSSSSKNSLSCGPSLSLPLSPSVEPSNSGQSTLRRQQHPVPPPSSTVSTLTRPGSQQASEFTTIVFSFCDEEVPYRTKAVGKQVTLRQFKELLPKRGNYRYFFKTECEDVETRVIQEEVMEDSEILPLWEGKIMAQVKPVE